MNRLKESNIFSGGGIIPLNNRRTLLKSYIWNYVVSNSGKATLENSIKGDIDLELIGNSVQLTTTGINLLPYEVGSKINSFLGGNTAVFKEEGIEITIKSAISTSEGDIYFFGNKQAGIEEGYSDKVKAGDYTILSNSKLCTFYVVVWRNGTSKVIINNSGEQMIHFTVLDGDKIRLFLRVKKSIDTEEAQIMLCKHTDVNLSYEPYTGLKPSPSPEYPQEIKSAGKWNEEKQKYEIDVKVTGKNLFDREKARDTANWIIRDGDGYAKFPIRVGKGNKATFSYTEKLTPGKGFYLGIAQSDTGSAVGWLYHSTEISLNNNKLTVVAKGDCLYLSCNKTSIQKFFDTIQTLQVEMGSEPTPYEPYTEQTLTLTSDRPITKWDRLVEQGGQYGWLYKHRIVNDLSALVKDSEPIYGKDGEKYFSVSLQGALFNYDYNKIYSVAGLCPKDSKIHYVPKPMIQSVVIYVSDTDTIMTAKEHMHYKVIYETTESQFAPLSESEQTQLRNLHSYNGTTHVFVDSGEVPCGIKVVYKQKK